MRFPKLTGNISITDEEEKVVIASDPEGSSRVRHDH